MITDYVFTPGSQERMRVRICRLLCACKGSMQHTGALSVGTTSGSLRESFPSVVPTDGTAKK